MNCEYIKVWARGTCTQFTKILRLEANVHVVEDFQFTSGYMVNLKQLEAKLAGSEALEQSQNGEKNFC